jgi:hypothetical protein
MKIYIGFLAFAFIILLNSCSGGKDYNIRPWSENPRYWQYKGKPVLLLGATDNDNLFQNNNVESHLDSLKKFGGNYIRNTMSDRDPGNIHAYALTSQGKYDLDKWNNEYWQRFEKLLKLAEERDIIVQIEIWDRFDHSRDPWLADPYNPKNNINYTYAKARLDSVYPLHPGNNKQPFFFTVPDLQNNEVLLKYQKAFVEKLLSVSVNYGNVLYCIDNETSGVEEWATYWAGFIRDNAKNKEIYITQMWDDWDVKEPVHKRTLDHPERYGYIDISQNSQLPGRQNWDNAQYVLNYINGNPRPVNSTKIYGNDRGSWLDRGITTEHAVQTFCRNVLGGFASSRFHRPPSGLGLSKISVNCLMTIRRIEEKVKMWEISPRMDLLGNNEPDKVYMSAKDGEYYVIYFTDSASTELDISSYNNTLSIDWISLRDAEWKNSESVTGGSRIRITSDFPDGAFAVLTMKNK